MVSERPAERAPGKQQCGNDDQADDGADGAKHGRQGVGGEEPLDCPHRDGADTEDHRELQPEARAAPTVGGEASNQAVFDRLHADTEENEAGGDDHQRRAGKCAHREHEGQAERVKGQVGPTQIIAIGDAPAEVLADGSDGVHDRGRHAVTDRRHTLGVVGRLGNGIRPVAQTAKGHRYHQNQKQLQTLAALVVVFVARLASRRRLLDRQERDGQPEQ